MMKKKLYFTLIVFFFIDTLYAEEIQNNNQSINNDNSLIPKYQCGPNEIVSRTEEVCELTCDVSTPLLKCPKKEASPCICSQGYAREDSEKCVPLSECSQKIFGAKILSTNTNFNLTQNAKLEEEQNITQLDDNKIVSDSRKHLSQRLNTFLHSLRSKMLKNSERTVRHLDSADPNVPREYRYYMSRLRESSKQAAGIELNL